ncbi:MAG: hypothetical protein V1874_17100 [Spirochaetota bacterium]
MDIDYKNLLEHYCGVSIHQSIRRWEENIFNINAEEKNLILNDWIIKPKDNLKLQDMLTHLVDAFDIIYDFTDKISNGAIIDFGFNEVIVCYEEVEKSIESVKKINTELLDMDKSLIYTTTLHKGAVIIGNWGARNRFKRMILGEEIDYCKMMNTIKLKEKTTCIVSEKYKDAVNDKTLFREIKDIGDVFHNNENKGKLYEFKI